MPNKQRNQRCHIFGKKNCCESSDSTNVDNATAIGLVHKESIGMRGNNLLSDWMSRRECHGVIFASINRCHAPSLFMFLLKKNDILIFGIWRV